MAALAAASRTDPDRVGEGLDSLLYGIPPQYARFEPHRHAGLVMLGLAGGSGSEESSAIAEQVGYDNTDTLQYLLFWRTAGR